MVLHTDLDSIFLVLKHKYVFKLNNEKMQRTSFKSMIYEYQ